MSRFSEEYEHWADAGEWQQDWIYTKYLNNNLSDNIAYAILARVEIRLEVNGVITTERDGDIIHGSDWNNNGKIDSLENLNVISYQQSVISEAN